MPRRAERGRRISFRVAVVAGCCASLLCGLVPPAQAQDEANAIPLTPRRLAVEGSGSNAHADVPLICPDTAVSGCRGTITLRTRFYSPERSAVIGESRYSLGWLQLEIVPVPLGSVALRALHDRGGLSVVAHITSAEGSIRRGFVLIPRVRKQAAAPRSRPPRSPRTPARPAGTNRPSGGTRATGRAGAGRATG